MRKLPAVLAPVVWLVLGCTKPAPTGDTPPAPKPSAAPVPVASAAPSTSTVPAASASASAAIDAGSKFACEVDLPSPPASIKDVSSKLIVKAIFPTLDEAHMVAKATKGKDGKPVVTDCHGGTEPAFWDDGNDGNPKGTAPGTVKVITRRGLPDGRQAIWLATAVEEGACTAQPGYGVLAIVALDGPHIAVLGVTTWNGGCHDHHLMRAEKLGGLTVYVEPDGFGTGAGNHDTEELWTLENNELHDLGHYDTLDEGGQASDGPTNDAGFITPPSIEAKPKFVGVEVVLSGETKWWKHDGDKTVVGKSEPWVERYVVKNGKLVMLPVPKGARKRAVW